MHRRCRQAALLVAGLALLVFLPSVGAGFVYDDVQLILKNEYIHALRWLPRAFMTHFWDVGTLADADAFNVGAEASRRFYRPLVTVSFLLTWVAVGPRAWVFHLTNVVIHAATSGLATRAAIRWTGSLKLGVLAGVVFAIHPTRSENVVWIAGRSDVLMLFFLLLSLEAFHRFERHRTWLSLTGALVALGAAVVSKEPALLTPLLLLARDRKKPDRVVFGLPAVVCAVYGVARAFFWRSEGSSPHTPSPGAFFYTLGAYVHRAIAPWPPTMYYDEVTYDAAGKPLYGWPLLLLGAVATVATLAALVLAWKRSRTAFWLLVVAACFMGPVLNLFGDVMKAPIQDRFLYAPLLFAVVGIARLFRDRLKRLVRERAFALAAIGVVLGMIGLIELRIPDFRTEDTFWEAELATHPNDVRALHMLGQNAAGRGELKLALEHFRRSGESGLRQRNQILFVMSHFEQAALVAALLPDGRVDDLRALDDELWRVVEPSAPGPSRREVEGFAVGESLPQQALQQQHDLTGFYWDAALVATRTGDFRRAEVAVSAASPTRTAAHPLNGALVLARIGRLNDAMSLVRKIRETASFQDLTTTAECDALSARLERAAALERAGANASLHSEQAAYDALRLAELGAYWSALRVVVQASLVDVEETTTLVVQLLVACRFDEAAREYAGVHMGAEGAALAEKITSGLPPSLKEAAPVPASLAQVLAAAKRPL